MNYRSRIIAVMALATASLAVLGARTAATAEETGKMDRTVSVSATGSVTAEPDIAHIAAGVVTEADSAKVAIARNTAVMAKLVDGLKAAGIAAKDLQTTHLNVAPRYTPAKDGRAQTMSGYRASNLVRVTVRDVKRLGEIVDQAIALGANQINQIHFAVADSEKLQDEARRQAMENARRRGELYAKAAGAELGAVLRISEGVRDLPLAGLMGGARFAGHAAAVVETGTQRLEVEVSVVYALR